MANNTISAELAQELAQAYAQALQDRDQQAEQINRMRGIFEELAMLGGHNSQLGGQLVMRWAERGMAIAAAGPPALPAPPAQDWAALAANVQIGDLVAAANTQIEQLQAEAWAQIELLGRQLARAEAERADLGAQLSTMRDVFARMMRQRDAAEALAQRWRLLINEYRTARDTLRNEADLLSNDHVLALIRQQRAADQALAEMLAPPAAEAPAELAQERAHGPELAEGPAQQAEASAELLGLPGGLQIATCPRCGNWLNNVSRGISIIAGGVSVCTVCLNPNEFEELRARSVESTT